MSLRVAPPDFDPDETDRLAVALRLDVQQYEAEIPVHQHRKGQLIVALRGAVTCRVPRAWSMVPPECGVWIPGGVPHSHRATANARLSFLFVEPGAAALPTQCCTLSISPMLREMILHLAAIPQAYERGGHTEQLVRVLLDELALMPVEHFHLPVSDHPKIRQIADAWSGDVGGSFRSYRLNHRDNLKE